MANASYPVSISLTTDSAPRAGNPHEPRPPSAVSCSLWGPALKERPGNATLSHGCSAEVKLLTSPLCVIGVASLHSSGQRQREHRPASHTGEPLCMTSCLRCQADAIVVQVLKPFFCVLFSQTTKGTPRLHQGRRHASSTH